MDNLRHPHPYGEPQLIRGRVKLIGRLKPYCPPEMDELEQIGAEVKWADGKTTISVPVKG